MKELPPFVNATGILQNLFNKVKEAPPPPRFTQDFMVTKLGIKKTGSSIPMIPFLKKIGFLGSDGVPTELYKRFRNPDKKISGTAIAAGMKIGYTELYSRNEYWHDLKKEELKNFLIEVTEADSKNTTIKKVINTIEVLKSFANFENFETLQEKKENIVIKKENREEEGMSGLNLSYTINLNLPETSDITVFDAIFKSLKENILRK